VRARPAPPALEAFGWFSTIATRFSDNDAFGHVNNAIYYNYMDSAICRYLIESCDYDPLNADHLLFAAENGCHFHAALGFPDLVRVGLAVKHIGTSSVQWHIGLFSNEQTNAAATGYFAHVVVDRTTRRPAPIPLKMRTAFERLMYPAGEQA